jgi:hypothetical protein
LPDGEDLKKLWETEEDIKKTTEPSLQTLAGVKLGLLLSEKKMKKSDAVEGSAPVTPRSQIQIPVQSVPHVTERVTLLDSVDFTGVRFPPTLHYKIAPT